MIIVDGNAVDAADSAPCIAIDGPAGVGKGTVSQRLALLSGWNYLNSGALYRVLGIQAQRCAVDLGDTVALVELAQRLQVEFCLNSLDNGAGRVELNGEDISDDLVTESSGAAASKVAPIPGVRAALLERQRKFLQPPGLVAEGRDMGSVVFPAAQLKIFLDASAQERARRRYEQLKDNGLGVSLRAVLSEIQNRDKRDRERSISPLVPAEDAIIIDTTALTVEEVVNQVLELCSERRLFTADQGPFSEQ